MHAMFKKRILKTITTLKVLEQEVCMTKIELKACLNEAILKNPSLAEHLRLNEQGNIEFYYLSEEIVEDELQPIIPTGWYSEKEWNKLLDGTNSSYLEFWECIEETIRVYGK